MFHSRDPFLIFPIRGVSKDTPIKYNTISFHDLTSPNFSTLITTSNTSKRVTQIVKERQYSRAMKTVVSTAVPTIIGPDLFQTMKTLHSTRCEPEHPLYAETVSEKFRSTIEPYIINPQETYKLMYKAPKCITPGIDGFRNEHKRALAEKFQNPAEVLFVNLYSQLLTSIANARIPHSIPDLLGGAELIALKQGVKKDQSL